MGAVIVVMVIRNGSGVNSGRAGTSRVDTCSRMWHQRWGCNKRSKKAHHDAHGRVLASKLISDFFLRPHILPLRVLFARRALSKPHPHPYPSIILRKGRDRRMDLLVDFQLAPPNADRIDFVRDGAGNLQCAEVEGGREAIGEQETEREAEDIGAGLGVS